MVKYHVKDSLLHLLSNYVNIKIPKNVRNNLDQVMDFLNITTDALSIVFVIQHFNMRSINETKGFFFH